MTKERTAARDATRLFTARGTGDGSGISRASFCTSEILPKVETHCLQFFRQNQRWMSTRREVTDARGRRRKNLSEQVAAISMVISFGMFVTEVNEIWIANVPDLVVIEMVHNFSKIKFTGRESLCERSADRRRRTQPWDRNWGRYRRVCRLSSACPRAHRSKSANFDRMSVKIRQNGCQKFIKSLV